MAGYRYPFLDLATVNAPYVERLNAAAAATIASGRYIGGEAVERFEEALAAYCGSEYVVGVSNGLDALRLIFRAYIELGRMAPGDEVIVPANTYIASILAVTDCGLRPVFVEPDPRTLNLDTSLLEAAVTPRTRAILTVHLYGRACYDATMADVARRHGLLIVEDNAQAIGAETAEASPRGTHRTGSLGDGAAFSFYPTKNLGALGDAGAVATHDHALAEAVRALANYGSLRRYNNIYKGVNCRLDPIQASFLSVKLPDLDAEAERRRALAAVYDAAIVNPLVAKPTMDAPDRAVWHQYVVRVADRDRFRAYLEGEGVQTDVHYAVPPHRQPCYAEYAGLSLPITDAIADSVVSLPISSCTTEADAREIALIINRFQ